MYPQLRIEWVCLLKDASLCAMLMLLIVTVAVFSTPSKFTRNLKEKKERKRIKRKQTQIEHNCKPVKSFVFLCFTEVAHKIAAFQLDVKSLFN